MARIRFRCKICGCEFDSATGKITFGMRLGFEKDITCPACGKIGMDDLELTELGQTQIAELFFEDETNLKNSRNLFKSD